MSGETPLIIEDLNLGLTVKEISLKYRKSECNIRAIAKRHNIRIKKTKQKEKNKESLIPQLPFQAAKYGGLGRLTVPWSLKEGMRKGKINDVESQIRYGLKTRFVGQ